MGERPNDYQEAFVYVNGFKLSSRFWAGKATQASIYWSTKPTPIIEMAMAYAYHYPLDNIYLTSKTLTSITSYSYWMDGYIIKYCKGKKHWNMKITCTLHPLVSCSCMSWILFLCFAYWWEMHDHSPQLQSCYYTSKHSSINHQSHQSNIPWYIIKILSLIFYTIHFY